MVWCLLDGSFGEIFWNCGNPPTQILIWDWYIYLHENQKMKHSCRQKYQSHWVDLGQVKSRNHQPAGTNCATGGQTSHSKVVEQKHFERSTLDPGYGQKLNAHIFFHNGLLPQSLTARPWKMVVGRLLSYWEGNFSGAMLNFGRVLPRKRTMSSENWWSEDYFSFGDRLFSGASC